ncbi:unnamed protein product, partial [Larinioides sclopetarius]
MITTIFSRLWTLACFVKVRIFWGEIWNEKVVESYDYVFPQNGLVAYKDGKLIGKKSILEHMGEEKLQPFISFCLEYMSKLQLPAKRFVIFFINVKSG